MDADIRRLVVNNEDDDLKTLADGGFNLQVAKSVIKNGELMYNVIWQSKVLAPTISIRWQPIYGLNWTTDLPAEGLSVSLGGRWMQCNLGQALDLDKYGRWQHSTQKQVPNFMAIGINGYRPDTATNGIHIVVGVQGAHGQFDPIFVDPVELGPNMGASYQPQEKVKWWYEAGMKTSTMISSAHSGAEEGDFSAPDPTSKTYTKTSSYNYAQGTWTTTAP